jgi:hypothetical protein
MLVFYEFVCKDEEEKSSICFTKAPLDDSSGLCLQTYVLLRLRFGGDFKKG